MAPPTMDLRFIIKKEQGKYYIIKHPTTTTFSFLFPSLKKNQEQQNNNPSSSSSVVDVTEDDRVCLHFSVGDPSCPKCDYQQQLTTNNKNRKRPQQQQQTLKNKKARINKCVWEEEEDLSANSSLCFIIKKEQGKYSIIKKPTFLFLFSSLKNKEDRQNNNNPSSDVDVTEDDRVCLHFSVGDPSCPSCNYQQQLTNNNNNKKRKRDPQQQQTLMNKKARINKWVWEEEEEEDLSVCLHLMLGSSSCMPTCCLHQTNNNIAAAAADDDHHDRWEMKKVLEKTDVCLHSCRLLISKDVAQKFIFPFLFGGTAEAAKSKQGVQLQVHDVDTDTLHSLVFKYWSSAKCHSFTKTWVKDFVHRRDLKKGDQIGLRWDQKKN